MTNTNNQNATNFALPNKQGIATNTWLLGFLGFFQFCLLWPAMTKMLGGNGPLSLLTSLIIAIIAVVCAYTINHLAVTRGAVLSALNFKGVRLLSITGIFTIGFAISSATITGNVQDRVGTIQLQEHHAKTANIVAIKNDFAIQATQAGPVLSAITSDLAAKVECERLAACLSESGMPGTGPITRLLVEKSARAQNIADILTEGEVERQESLERMNKLLSEYQGALDNDEFSFREKRSVLQKIYAQIVSEGATLDNAIPTSLLFAYANELQSKVDLNGRPKASRNVDAVLNGHGDALLRVLENIKNNASQFTPFPKSASLADTLSYITYYWPFAAVVYGAEIGLPFMLFFITYSRLYWVRFTEHGANQTVKRRDDVDDFRELLRAQSVASKNTHQDMVSQNDVSPPHKVGRPQKNSRANGASRNGMDGR